jgi:hypothetical protein
MELTPGRNGAKAQGSFFSGALKQAFAIAWYAASSHLRNRPNCSQAAKKFPGSSFSILEISILLNLFRISDFGFRISSPAFGSLR